MNLSIGQILANRYRIEAFIGRGGSADVYKVWDAERSTYLAIKLLNEDLAQNPVFLKHFRREAQILAHLKHPNIVRYYGLGQDGLLAFISMDYVDGTSLRAEIVQNLGESFSPKHILEIMRPVCSALHFAHRQGLVHCDIKPANIMINKNKVVVLTDFGIARMTTSTTAALGGAGTSYYMAPEQIRGEVPTPQMDIYALGVTLFEMLTGGERPFTGDHGPSSGTTRDKVQWEHINLLPPSPRKFNPKIPPALETIVHRCLEKDPHLRYESTLALFNELNTALAGLPMDTWQPDSTKSRQSKSKTKIDSKGLERKIHGAHGTVPRWLWPAIAGVVLVVFMIFGTFEILAPRPSTWPISIPTSNQNSSPDVPGAHTTLLTENSSPGNILPLTYNVGSCMTVQVDAKNHIDECVTSVTLLPDGNMQFDFSWTAQIEDHLELEISPDTNTKNMYLTDNLGNRYDHLQTGGDASRQVTLTNGQTALGRFLFGPPVLDAQYFIFHDDDNNVKTPPIQRVWP